MTLKKLKNYHLLYVLNFISILFYLEADESGFFDLLKKAIAALGNLLNKNIETFKHTFF